MKTSLNLRTLSTLSTRNLLGDLVSIADELRGPSASGRPRKRDLLHEREGLIMGELRRRRPNQGAPGARLIRPLRHERVQESYIDYRNAARPRCEDRSRSNQQHPVSDKR